MKVKDRMTPNPYTIAPEASIYEAWTLMHQHEVTRLPVLDQQKIVGIITTSDIGARRDLDFRGLPTMPGEFTLAEEHLLNRTKVRDVMSSEQAILTIEPDAYIEQAAKLLREINTPGLLVVNSDDKLVGIITQADIFDALLDLLAINRNGTRISLRVDDNPETWIKILQILKKHNLRIENFVSMEIKDEPYLLIMRVNTIESQPIVDDFKAAGLSVESIVVKQ